MDDLSVVDPLLAWGATHRRDLPWRRTRDPWAVLVSEVMLQQTQVPRVVPKYEAFMTLFPSAHACAAAAVGDVVRAWAGLGYNRRAVRLHEAACSLAVEVPRTVEGWMALPGVGPYTARAVMAYALGADTAVVDTNVVRVLARRGGVAMTRREAQMAADAWMPTGRSLAWSWNSALMDLGQHVCVPGRPRCGECPTRPGCAFAAGGADAWRADSRQGPFEGSDRQARGRLVDALRLGTVAIADTPELMGWPDDPARAERVWRGVVTDGLAVVAADGERLALPG